MPDYEGIWFAPPAPLARVALINPQNGTSETDIPMLLDSGADITLLPQKSVLDLDISPVPAVRYELVNFDGQKSFASVLQLEMLFPIKTFRGQFLLIEQEWGIIGRNILNQVSLFFDGPNEFWDRYNPVN